MSRTIADKLQALTAELRDGLFAVMEDLSTLKQRDSSLEEAVRDLQSDTEEKILGLRNSLNTFKEDLLAALSLIREVNSRHREIQQGLERFQTEVGRELLSVPRRKGSKEDFLSHAHMCVSSEMELSVLQRCFDSLPNGSPKRSSASTQTSNSEQELGCQQQQQQGGARSPVWGEKERRGSADTGEGDSTQENSKRQAAALELLESERVYVSYLSLLLKANITFNGSEAAHLKDKRAFPSSLRFLIQQHLELLHTLQERVLKCQWQGIMGDVFMRLTSKESDFLDYYVAYLKELPECLSAVSVYSATALKSVGLFESDVMGNESHPTLHSLLLQPVQRIPEYLLLLQNLMKHTDCEHPDYYLLLVCIQQFRAFTGQHSHLLQHNEELLLQNRKQLRRSAVQQLFRTVDCGMQLDMGSPGPPSKASILHTSQLRKSKQRHLEPVQSKRFSDWEAKPRRYNPVPGGAPSTPFFNLDADPRLKSPVLRSIPEAEPEAGPGPPRKRQPPGVALADTVGSFLPPGEGPGLEGLCEDCDSLHNVPLSDNVSSASSESSVDIAFVRYPKSHGREAYGGGGGRTGGYRLPTRGCVSPDEEGMMRHHHPLQAVQRKSRSLNGLQLDSTVSADTSPAMGYKLLGGHAHPQLERRPSKGSTNHKLQRSASPAHGLEDDSRNTTEEEFRRDHDKDCTGGHAWGEQPRWRARPENDHAPFSQRSRKQDQKGGLRSSFKKLFKKKSGGDGKDKASDKSVAEVYSDHESMKSPRVTQPGDIDRGTAV
ncbi:hypothetical protein AAFF_G00062760 [Aldrovandia affinis]|uniref:DH domain-containing protein n=1 Tax=Aldrovandia affinis TaxID=143900 RepID=A0AAD7RZH0_9TELE|nr:hypothetical protein AAFF_G00062760 [Aldrovandia affinis]